MLNTEIYTNAVMHKNYFKTKVSRKSRFLSKELRRVFYFIYLILFELYFMLTLYCNNLTSTMYKQLFIIHVMVLCMLI